MKKVFIGLFAICGMLTFSQNANAVNLVDDNSFENNVPILASNSTFDTWIMYGKNVEVQKIAVDEADTMYIDGNKKVGINTINLGGGIQQRGVSVESGVTYRFRFKYKLDSGYLYPRLGDNNSNGDFEGKNDRLYPTNGVWKEYSRVFTAPDSIDFRIVINSRDAQAYIDDVIIEPYSLSNLLVDGDMELLGTDHWRTYGRPPVMQKNKNIVSDDSIDSMQSIELNTVGTSGGFQKTNIPVVAGEKYVLSFDYLKNSGQLKAYLGVNTSNGDFEGKYDFFPKTLGTWNHYEREFIVPENFTGDFRLIFSLRDGEAYIDNVVLRKQIEVYASSTHLIISEISGESVEAITSTGNDTILGKYNMTATEENILLQTLTFVIRNHDNTAVADINNIAEVHLVDERSGEYLGTASPHLQDGNIIFKYYNLNYVITSESNTLVLVPEFFEDPMFVGGETIQISLLDDSEASILAWGAVSGQVLGRNEIGDTENYEENEEYFANSGPILILRGYPITYLNYVDMTGRLENRTKIWSQVLQNTSSNKLLIHSLSYNISLNNLNGYLTDVKLVDLYERELSRIDGPVYGGDQIQFLFNDVNDVRIYSNERKSLQILADTTHVRDGLYNGDVAVLNVSFDNTSDYEVENNTYEEHWSDTGLAYSYGNGPSSSYLAGKSDFSTQVVFE